jgi:myo-inositol-1-phosphate synthase
MKGDFIKISFQDIEIAEEFFENSKHLNEFLCSVISYYRGELVAPKTKIVSKYFNSYKKTMDYVINAKELGRKGASQRFEKQPIKESTLEGSLLDPLEESLPANNKVISNKDKVISKKEKKEKEISAFSPPSLEEFLNYVYLHEKRIGRKIDISEAKSKFYAWEEDGWRDGHGKQIKNWKSKISHNSKHWLESQSTRRENSHVSLLNASKQL